MGDLAPLERFAESLDEKEEKILKSNKDLTIKSTDRSTNHLEDN